MGEIADEHYTEMFWEEGTGVGEYTSEYGIGPIDHPAYGGMNAYLARHTSRIAPQYSCKFCNREIKFINRRPYNMADGSAHTCLADAAKVKQVATPQYDTKAEWDKLNQLPWFNQMIDQVKADARSTGYTEGYNKGYKCAQNDLTKGE